MRTLTGGASVQNGNITFCDSRSFRFSESRQSNSKRQNRHTTATTILKYTMTTDDNRHEASSLLDIIRHVVEILQDAQRSDEGETAGHRTVLGRPFQTDYEFTVNTGLDPNPHSHWDHLGLEELSSETSTTSTDTEEGYLVDVREEGDAIIVLADLPQATAESVTTEIDHERNELVIELSGTTIDRIPLDNTAITVTDSTFNNGVFEVRLQTDESIREGAADE